MLQSSIVNVQLQATPYYPFTLDGPLCPLLNDAEVLSGFYAEESLHHTIKQFCKRTTWPGKPAASYSVDSEKLKELLISLFNSPVGRATLRQKSEKGRCDYFDNAIWQWLTTANPTLRARLSGCCDDIKGRLFIKHEAWVALLMKIQSENPALIPIQAGQPVDSGGFEETPPHNSRSLVRFRSTNTSIQNRREVAQPVIDCHQWGNGRSRLRFR